MINADESQFLTDRSIVLVDEYKCRKHSSSDTFTGKIDRRGFSSRDRYVNLKGEKAFSVQHISP